MITAVVLIHAEANAIPQTARTIAEIEGVSQVYSVAGDIDLIAIVKVNQHDELADVIANKVASTSGVVRTQTNIAFRTYSHDDLDSAFSLGLD